MSDYERELYEYSNSISLVKSWTTKNYKRQ